MAVEAAAAPERAVGRGRGVRTAATAESAAAAEASTTAAAATAEPAAAAAAGVVRGRRVLLQSLPACITACHVLQRSWLLDPTQEEQQLGPLVGLVSAGRGAPPLLLKLQGGPLDPVLLQQLHLSAADALEQTRQQLQKALNYPNP